MKGSQYVAIVVAIVLAASGVSLVALEIAHSQGASTTTVSSVLAGNVPAGQDVTLEDTRVVAVVNDTNCGTCDTWEIRTTVTLEALSNGAQINAILKKVGGNLLQYKKQNGVPYVGLVTRFSGTVAHGATWTIDPAKEWVEFDHAGPTVSPADVKAGRYPVGRYVWLTPVTVERQFDSSDGDWHVQVGASGVSDLTTEITPPHEDELPKPRAGDVLEIYGMILYDGDHDNWEIHPIRCVQRNVCAGGASAGVPGAPNGLAASAGDGEVRLSWSAPGSTGGSPITHYSIYRAMGTGAFARLENVSALEYIDGDVENGVLYRYAVSATSAQGEGPRSAEASATPNAGGSKVWLAESFETDFDLWTSTALPDGSAWERTETRAVDGLASITCGTGTTYEPSADCAVVTPRLDLRRATSAILNFSQFVDVVGVSALAVGDVGTIDLSKDGGLTWRALGVAPGPSSNEWAAASFDLASAYGAADVRIRFHFTSDPILEGAGWFVDNVTINGKQRAPSPPTSLGATRNADNSVRLSWTASVDGGAGTTYRVYRGAIGTSLAFYAEAGAGTTWTDTAPSATEGWYAVTAWDGLESGFSNTVQAPNGGGPPGNVLFEDKFETGATGWTVVKRGPAGSSKWNIVTSQSTSPTHSYSPGGGTSYGAATDTDLVSPTVSLAGAPGPKVKFQHKIGGEASRDYGRVYYSTDGGSTWTQSGGPYAGVAAWTPVTFNLPAGAPSVKVKFTFVSDSNGVQNAAWFVDDVQITSS